MYRGIRRKRSTPLSKVLLTASLLVGAFASPAEADPTMKVPIFPNASSPSWPRQVFYSYDLKLKLHPAKFDNSPLPSPSFQVKADGSLITATGKNFISQSISIGSLEEIHESTGQASIRIEPDAGDTFIPTVNWLKLTAKANVQPNCAKEKDSCKDISALANVKIGDYGANDQYPKISGTLPVSSVISSSVTDPQTIKFQYSIMPEDNTNYEFSPFTIGFYMPTPTSLDANLIFKASDLYATEFKIFGGIPGQEMVCLLDSTSSSCDSTFVDTYRSAILSQWHYEPTLLGYILDSPLLFPEIGYRFVGSASHPSYTTTSSTFYSDPASGVEAVPVPLPVLGIGAAFGYTRRLRMLSERRRKHLETLRPHN